MIRRARERRRRRASARRSRRRRRAAGRGGRAPAPARCGTRDSRARRRPRARRRSASGSRPKSRIASRDATRRPHRARPSSVLVDACRPAPAADERHAEADAFFLGEADDLDGERQPPAAEQVDERDAEDHAEDAVEGAGVRHGVEMRADEQPRRVGDGAGVARRAGCRPRRRATCHAGARPSSADRSACTSRIGAREKRPRRAARLLGMRGQRRRQQRDHVRARVVTRASRSPVRAVAVRREQQRHVVVARARSAMPTRTTTSSRNGGSVERDAGAAEVVAGVKRQLVDAGLEPVAGEQRRVGAAVGVGRRRRDRAARTSPPQRGAARSRRPAAGDAARRVEHVSRQTRHSPSSPSVSLSPRQPYGGRASV